MAALMINEAAKVIVPCYLSMRLILAPSKRVKTSCRGCIIDMVFPVAQRSEADG